jgi:hypothetical protein
MLSTNVIVQLLKAKWGLFTGLTVVLGGVLFSGVPLGVLAWQGHQYSLPKEFVSHHQTKVSRGSSVSPSSRAPWSFWIHSRITSEASSVFSQIAPEVSSILPSPTASRNASVSSQNPSLLPPPTDNSPLPAPVSCSSCWHPPVTLTFQWQLTGTVDQSYNAELYDIDLFDNPASVVASLHQAGHKVACYIDAGTWENERPDASEFPASVLGNSNGWPGEKWLDIRQVSVLAPIMNARMELCKSNGYDAVEFDNIDGYSNSTGFPLTAQDQLVYDTWLANQAHTLGLSVALKNDTDQISTLLPYFDWDLDEQCIQYNECDTLLPFIQAGKPVIDVEYVEYQSSTGAPSSFCPKLNAMDINGQQRDLNLDATPPVLCSSVS